MPDQTTRLTDEELREIATADDAASLSALIGAALAVELLERRRLEWEDDLEWEEPEEAPATADHRPAGGRHRAPARPMSSRQSALAVIALWLVFVSGLMLMLMAL